MFRRMAERIEKMEEGEFAGAILVVPPDPPPEIQGMRNEPIVLLNTEEKPDLGHFWGSAKMRMDGAVQLFQEELRKRQTGMGFR